MTARIVPDYRKLSPLLDAERARGRKVVVANGCFDLLHVGHVRLLAGARSLGDVLVVALNGDDTVRRSKGDGRPLFPLAERMEILAALEGIAYVTSFDEPTAGPLLACLRPDVQVKGTDWTPENVPEREAVLAYGGRVAIAGDPKCHSSREIIARLAGLADEP